MSPESSEISRSCSAGVSPSPGGYAGLSRQLTLSFGIVRQAAVLVILFQRPGDDKLSVVLTTRAKTLR